MNSRKKRMSRISKLYGIVWLTSVKTRWIKRLVRQHKRNLIPQFTPNIKILRQLKYVLRAEVLLKKSLGNSNSFKQSKMQGGEDYFLVFQYQKRYTYWYYEKIEICISQTTVPKFETSSS